MSPEVCTVPEVGRSELSSRPLGQREQVPQPPEQHVHPGERAPVQKHPQTLAATEACRTKYHETDTKKIPRVNMALFNSVWQCHCYGNVYLHKVNNSFLANSDVLCTQQLKVGRISSTSTSPYWRWYNTYFFCKRWTEPGLMAHTCSSRTFSCKPAQPADDGSDVVAGQRLRPPAFGIQHAAWPSDLLPWGQHRDKEAHVEGARYRVWKEIWLTPTVNRSTSTQWLFMKASMIGSTYQRRFNHSSCNVLKRISMSGWIT